MMELMHDAVEHTTAATATPTHKQTLSSAMSVRAVFVASRCRISFSVRSIDSPGAIDAGACTAEDAAGCC